MNLKTRVAMCKPASCRLLGTQLFTFLEGVLIERVFRAPFEGDQVKIFASFFFLFLFC